MYTEYQPSHLLAPYIDNYWEFKGNPEYGMRIHILPDGCTCLLYTSNQGLDPEQGITGITYYRSPAMRTISGGINISF